MLEPEQFDGDIPLPDFSVAVDNLWLGSHEIGAAEIPTSYDQNWRVVFHLGKFASGANILGADHRASIKLSGADDVTNLLIRKVKFGSRQDDITVEAQPAIDPLIIPSSETGNGFRGVLLSAPDFIQRAIVLNEHEGPVFRIEPFGAKGSTKCVISSNSQLSPIASFEMLATLRLFLIFLKGSYCGLGNVRALSPDGASSFDLLGFSKTSDAARKTNWFDIEVQQDLPEIFAAFSEAMVEPTTKKALLQAINFYLAANDSRDVSIEMAIIAAHSALEAIINYILERRAGWSANLMAERSISVSDKLRAAAASFGLHGDVLEHSPELKKLSKSRADMDVFALISFIRNKLVHQDQKFSPSGMQLHETWLVAQWLVEVLIFGIIGYRGEIIDRRIYNGWRGTTVQIPLSS